MKPFCPILAEGPVFYIGVSLGKRKQSYNEVLQSNRQTKTEQHTRLEKHSGSWGPQGHIWLHVLGWTFSINASCDDKFRIVGRTSS